VPDERTLLRADCSRCVGLCCVVPAFAKSADFAIGKPSRTPCPNLADDFGCSIHTELRDRGFPGCTVYDCFGAGQHVVQVLFGGRPTTSPQERRAMGDAFEVVERLNELLWYLADARSRPGIGSLSAEVEGLTEAVERVRRDPVGADVTALQSRADPLLGEVSTAVRAGLEGEDLRGRDLAGQDLRSRDLYAAGLRGSLLIGADLRGLDLGPADVLGADLRGTDVSGADLSEALFLTRFQVNAARGDATTTLPDVVDRPAHWG
jgi:hypothetical protein